MFNKVAYLASAGIFLAGAGVGVMSSHVMAAAQAATSPADAMTRVLIDNETVKVSLVSYPQGSVRDGGQKRPFEQVVVWLDDGDYKVIPRPGEGVTPAPKSNNGADARGPESAIGPDGSIVHGVHPLGTVAWHPKESAPVTMAINKTFRTLLIDIKK